MHADLTDAEGALAEHAHHALCAAIADAFETMAGMVASIGPVRAHSAETEPHGSPRTIVAVIGLMGRWSGAGILECTPEFACLLANRMLGIEAGPFNEDALDAVAEMSNILFGGMKTELEHWLGTMKLGTPTVLYGNEVGVSGHGEGFTVVPLAIEGHELWVKLDLSPVLGKRDPMTQFWAARASTATARLDRDLSLGAKG